jgi:hypothetical protein
LKLARCFILKDSLKYTNAKIVSPLVSPTLTLWNHDFVQAEICNMSESFHHVNLSYSESVVHKEKNSMKNFKIPFTQGWFVPSLIEIGLAAGSGDF